MPDWFSSALQHILDFSNTLNTSISASWLILVVIVLRLLLKKAPKWAAVALWGMVALRLLMPFSIESIFSLVPSAETISGELLRAGPVPGAQPAYLEIVTNPSYGREVTMEMERSIGSFQWDLLSMTFAWLAGVAIMAIYTAVSCWRLHRKVSTAVVLWDNLFQSEHIASPFVLGIFKPKIYLPYDMDAQNLHHVIAHEQAHIRRKDHWWKPLGFILLAVHWFNPLMWLAYVLLCRDIELACDEKVIQELGNEQRADYTQALLTCSVDRRMVTACPLAFGEVGVKERVRSVMNYKKTSFWIVLLAVVICAAVAVCFLTNPAGEDTPAEDDSYYLVIGSDGVMSVQISGEKASGGVVNADGSGFQKGEKVWLEPLEGVTDLRGISITALDADGEILYILSIPEGMTDAGVLNLVGSDEWLLVPADYFGEAVSYAGGADGPESIISKQKLTLDDVCVLAEKGYDLSWADFEAYAYHETGSGLYIRVYEINELFELWIGGSDPDSAPMYIYLSLADDLDTRIDIRDGGVEAFIAADHSEILLTNAIYDAILEHNKPPEPDGLYHCASFVLLDRQELCICGDRPIPIQVIVYGMALHQAFSFTDTGLRDEQGSHIPVMLTFEEENGVYTLLEYWQPRDGSYYEQDIRDKFPDAVENDALDTQKYILSQMQNCYDQAVRYGGVDTDTVIEQLLEVISSSLAYSSNPGAYIDAQPIEYRELTYYGRYTLQYCFDRFLQGGQTDLMGHIMALVCQDIADSLGEKEEPLENVVLTGQDWFDGFYAYAQVLAKNHSAEDLEKYYPATFLLLQMADPLCGYPPAEAFTEIVKIEPAPKLKLLDQYDLAE